MIVSEITKLNNDELFLTEMGNIMATITELPANIVIWLKPQPNALPHSKYRCKVIKDRHHTATFSICPNPVSYHETHRGKFKLDSDERKQVIQFISTYSSLLISYVDAKIDLDELKYEILRNIS